MLPLMLMLMLADAPPATEAAAAPVPVVEDGCGLVIEKDGQKSVTPSPEVHVMGVGGPLHISAPEGAKLLGLMCHRSSIVPDAEDDRVPRGVGVPLYIAGNGVTVKLTLTDGAYGLRALDGTVTPEDQAKIDAVLALFKTRLGAGG